MSVTAESLRELHHLHQRIADLNSRLKRGPQQIKAGQANVAKLEQDLEQARQTTRRAKMTCDEKQLQLKSSESRIADLQGKLNAASSNKEYQAIKEQIAADEMANSVLQDEILEMFDRIENCEATAKAVSDNLGKTREELDRVIRRVGDEQASLEADLAGVQQRLAEAEAKLPIDFRTEYDRIAKARGDEALAPLEGEICGGCNFRVTPQMINDVMLCKPVFCKSCGCLLYMPESGGE
ncbi:MAG: hypothetical protein KDA41_23060 [Planctomycetales bacterium]|nr:hypothetical protein [Planctomycetales bacterium]